MLPDSRREPAPLRKLRVRRLDVDTDAGAAPELEASIIAACRLFVPATSDTGSAVTADTAGTEGKGIVARGASEVVESTVVAGNVNDDAVGFIMASFGLAFDNCKRRALLCRCSEEVALRRGAAGDGDGEPDRMKVVVECTFGGLRGVKGGETTYKYDVSFNPWI